MGPELKHVSDHIGSVIDNSRAQDLVNAFLNIGLAYAGYEIFRDWKGALLGPISLKLATSNNLAAGTAGVVGLASLGLAAGAGKKLSEILLIDVPDPPEIPGPGQTDPETGEPKGRCGENMTLMIRMGALLCVPDDQIGNFEYRGWEKHSDYVKRIA